MKVMSHDFMSEKETKNMNFKISNTWGAAPITLWEPPWIAAPHRQQLRITAQHLRVSAQTMNPIPCNTGWWIGVSIHTGLVSESLYTQLYLDIMSVYLFKKKMHIHLRNKKKEPECCFTAKNVNGDEGVQATKSIAGCWFQPIPDGYPLTTDAGIGFPRKGPSPRRAGKSADFSGEYHKRGWNFWTMFACWIAIGG